MKFNPSPFCDKTVAEIVDTSIKNYVIHTINRIWRKDSNSFLGAQPVSIARSDFFKLKKFRYVYLEKTDGVRYFLFCTLLENHPVCIFIDRALTMYCIELSFAKSIFYGTIFDGEIVKDKNNQWNYLIFDIIQISGDNVLQQSFENRMEHANKTISTLWKKNTFPLFICVKPLFSTVKDVIDNQKMLSHKSDGIICMPCEQPVRTGRQFSMFKWKQQLDNTVDFIIRPGDTPGLFLLCVYKDEMIQPVTYTYPKTPFIWNMLSEHGLLWKSSSSNIIDSIVEDNEEIQPKDIVVECKFDTDDNIWIPVHYRPDKTQSNDYLTFRKTMVNIQENIQIHELIEI